MLIRSQRGCADAHRVLLTLAAEQARAMRPARSEAEVRQAVLRVHRLRHTFRPGASASHWLERVVAGTRLRRARNGLAGALGRVLAQLRRRLA